MLKYFDKPDAKPGTYFLLVLIFSVVWLLMLLAWYLVGLPIGPVFTHVCLKRERMLRLLEEKLPRHWVHCG